MVQTIAELLQKKGNRTRQASLPASLERKKNEITATYGSREQFMRAFNPAAQRTVCNNPEVCFFGGAPTLAQLNATYGGQTAAAWLVPQLYDLSEYSGSKEKLQGVPLEDCATVIAADFHYLNVTELMLFFRRFKSGLYGHFYASVDPLKITTALRTFLTERAAAIERHEQQLRDQRDEESRRNAITYPEYQRRKAAAHALRQPISQQSIEQ